MMAPRYLALGVVAALVGPSPLLAHHDWPVDRTHPVTIQGTVTAFTWANPHVTIALDVDANGTVEKWIVGASSPKNLSDNGWDKNTFRPGDTLTATGYRFRNGSNVLQLQRLVTPSGRALFYAGPRSAGDSGPAPPEIASLTDARLNARTFTAGTMIGVPTELLSLAHTRVGRPSMSTFFSRSASD